MLSTNFPPRHRVGRKARTWVLLLAVYLPAILSNHYLSVTFCMAVTPLPSNSASEEEKVVEKQQPGTAASSPPVVQCLPEDGQDCAPRVQGGVRAGPHLPTGSGLCVLRNRQSAESSFLPPARAGSIFFVYASLLLGKGGPEGRSASRCESTERNMRDTIFGFFPRLSTREAALALASLAVAVRHFRMVMNSPKRARVAAASEAAAGSQAESATGNGDKHPHEAERCWTSRHLHRFASADELSEAAPGESAQSEQGESAEVTDIKKSKSLKNLRDTIDRSPHQGDRRFFTLRRFSGGGTRTPDSLTPPAATSPSKKSWRALKSFFFSKDQGSNSSPSASKAKTPSRHSIPSDNRGWCGVVAAVADAISEACDRCEHTNVTSTTVEEKKEVVSEECVETPTTGMPQSSSLPPDNTKDEIISVVHKESREPEAARVIHKKDVMSRNPKTLLPSNATLDGTQEESTVTNVQSHGRSTQSASKAGPTEMTGKKPHSRGRGRRGLSFARKEASVPAKPASSSSTAKSVTISSFRSSVRRRSSSDRKSSSGSDIQKPKSYKSTHRGRRWLGFRKGKQTSKPQLLAFSSVEDDAEASGRAASGTMEAVVREELERQKTSPLLTTGKQWWRESKEIKLNEVLQRITAALPRGHSLREAASATAKQWTTSVIGSAMADISHLIIRAARLTDWEPLKRARSEPEATSFLTDRYCRLSFFVVSSEVLDLAVSEGFSLIVLKESKHLRKIFTDFEMPQEERDEALKGLLMHVAKMQALAAVTDTVEVSEAASAAIGRAHLELLKLAERIGDVEGTTPLIEYYLSGLQTGDLIEDRIRQMVEEIEREVIIRVYRPHEKAIVERLSRHTARPLLEVALAELFLRLVKSYVRDNVAADVQAAKYKLPDVSLPPVYHLIGLLSDDKVKQDIIEHHTQKAEDALPRLLYYSTRKLLPRLAQEYLWLQDTARMDLETLFDKERHSLNTRVLVLIALGEEFHLQHSTFMRKLKRIVKVAKQLEFGSNNKAATAYIFDQLTSPATEPGEVIFADFAEAGGGHQGASIEKSFLQSLAWSPSFSGSESGGSEPN